MNARNLPDALRLIMRQRGWTQADLARELDVSQSWVSRALRGLKDPGTARTIKLLDRVGWEVRITPKGEESDPVKRRDFMLRTASAAPAVFVPALAVSPYQDPAYVRALTGRLTGDMYELGGISLASNAIRHVQNVEPAITGRNGDLQIAAADLACEATWALYDAGLFDAAERSGNIALALAQKAGDFESQSRAYSALTQVSIERGQPHRGVMYARRGLQLSDISESQRAWLNMRLGRSLALIRGQERAARGTLDMARSFDDLSLFETADMAGCVGVVFADLRVFEEAHTSLDEAVRLTEQGSTLLYAKALGHRIKAALRDSQPALAADRMELLSRVVPMVSSYRLDKRVNHILAESARWTSVPEMRNARDQLQAVVPARRKAP